MVEVGSTYTWTTWVSTRARSLYRWCPCSILSPYGHQYTRQTTIPSKDASQIWRAWWSGRDCKTWLGRERGASKSSCPPLWGDWRQITLIHILNMFKVFIKTDWDINHNSNTCYSFLLRSLSMTWYDLVRLGWSTLLVHLLSTLWEHSINPVLLELFQSANRVVLPDLSRCLGRLWALLQEMDGPTVPLKKS